MFDALAFCAPRSTICQLRNINTRKMFPNRNSVNCPACYLPSAGSAAALLALPSVGAAVNAATPALCPPKQPLISNFVKRREADNKKEARLQPLFLLVVFIGFEV